MIKVVHFLPSVNYTSGISNLLMNYYRLIDRTKIQFDFLYFCEDKNPNFRQEIELMGGEVHKISSPKHFIKFYKDLKKYFTKQKMDKIIFHNHQIAFTVFLYPILLKFGIKQFIVHNHMTKYSDRLLSAIRNFILCVPIKYMNLSFFACSREAGELMIGCRKKLRDKIVIMNNGIDCNKFKFSEDNRIKMRNEMNLQDSFVVGHIGHFEPVKNHEFIIDVYKNVLKKNKNSKLLLIGAGSIKKKIQKIILDSSIDDKVIILENRIDIPELLSAMDVFIFPSKFEGLGIAAIEAQSTGLPVIMSDNVPDEVNVTNCKVISLSKSSEFWALELLNSKISNNSRKKANLIVQESFFNIKKNVSKIENLYFEMLKK